MVRLQFQCPAVAGGRVIQHSLGPQRGTQVVVCLDVVRFQLHCPAVAGDRVVQLSLALQGIAQVVVERGHGPTGADRPSDVLDGKFVLAHLVGDDSQQVPGVGVVRLGGEDPPVALLGGRESARLMVLEGNRQCLGSHAENLLWKAANGRVGQAERSPTIGFFAVYGGTSLRSSHPPL